MSAITVSKLTIYPVKSLRGIRLESVQLLASGPQYDRQWMVVDQHGKFLSQRRLPTMCLIETWLDNGVLTLSQAGANAITVPCHQQKEVTVTVWKDTVTAFDCGDEVADWLGELLGKACRLVYMPHGSERDSPPGSYKFPSHLKFADAYPLLLAGEASLAKFNSHLQHPINMAHFRPNIELAGSEAFAEDSWQEITIADQHFVVAAPCTRCIVPSIDPATGEKDQRVIEALNKHRRFGTETRFRPKPGLLRNSNNLCWRSRRGNKVKRNTRLMHAGRDKKYTGNIVNPNIARASTIVFDSVSEMEHAARNKDAGVEYYGRHGTTTTFAFAEAMAELDNAAGCYVYPCGTAAITGSLLSFLASGDHLLVVDSVYEPTRNFCSKSLARMGVETTYYDPMIGAEIESLVQNNTKVIFLESPGSLSMEVQDVPAIAEVARKHGIVTIIDNTYATPWNFKPLDVGIDISVQSATKYINGHSDVMLGIACANEQHWPQLQNNSYELAFCASPDDIYTSLRGSRTLGVRLQQHEANARFIADWLQQRSEVDHLRHPQYSTCPGHEFYNRDCSGANGLFSFVLKGGDEAAAAQMLDGMQHFKMGFSWGGYESLILAANNMQARRTATEWQQPGPLIRLHIGLEDPEDLIEDLAAGLDRFIKALGR